MTVDLQQNSGLGHARLAWPPRHDSGHDMMAQITELYARMRLFVTITLDCGLAQDSIWDHFSQEQ